MGIDGQAVDVQGSGGPWGSDVHTSVELDQELGIWCTSTSITTPDASRADEPTILGSGVGVPFGSTLATAEVFASDTQYGGVDGLDDLWDRFDAASADLEMVVERVRREYRATILDEEFSYFTRLVVLDSVDVPTEFRGMGFGRRAAATALYVAGAWADSVLVAGMAGVRGDGSPAERAVIEERAAHLLASLGLCAYGAPAVFFGITTHSSPSSEIRSLAVR